MRARSPSADGLVEGTGQEVGGRQARIRRGQGLLRQPHRLGGRVGSQRRGRSKGVGLDVIDREGEVAVVPGSGDFLVEAVGASVGVAQLIQQVRVGSGD